MGDSIMVVYIVFYSNGSSYGVAGVYQSIDDADAAAMELEARGAKVHLETVEVQ